MVMVKGGFTNLFGEGLKKEFKKLYEISDGEPIKYQDPIIVDKKFGLGFILSKDIIDNDLYVDQFNLRGQKKMKKKINTKVQVTYMIELDEYHVLKMSNDIISIPSYGLNVKDLPAYIKGLKKLVAAGRVKPRKSVGRRKIKK